MGRWKTDAVIATKILVQNQFRVLVQHHILLVFIGIFFIDAGPGHRISMLSLELFSSAMRSIRDVGLIV